MLDEQLTDLLRCLPDNPAMHEKVLDSIFSIPSRLTGSGGAAAAALEAPGAPIPVQASHMRSSGTAVVSCRMQCARQWVATAD